MLRSLPGLLDPGVAPVLDSPDEASGWVRGVEWLIRSQGRGILLHVDETALLTCVAVANHLLKHLGPQAKDAMIHDALHCGCAAVVAVDVRRKVPPNGVSSVDRRLHEALRNEFALHCVVLLDTVIVAPTGGLSVTGSLRYVIAASPSWLQIHIPERRAGLDEWSHESAAGIVPGRTGDAVVSLLKAPRDGSGPSGRPSSRPPDGGV